MFSFLQEKSRVLEAKEELKDGLQKLTDQANTNLSTFGFLFRSTPKPTSMTGTTTIGFQNSAFSVVNMLSSNSCKID